jgi:hypothetical protein
VILFKIYLFVLRSALSSGFPSLALWGLDFRSPNHVVKHAKTDLSKGSSVFPQFYSRLLCPRAHHLAAIQPERTLRQPEPPCVSLSGQVLTPITPSSSPSLYLCPARTHIRETQPRFNTSPPWLQYTCTAVLCLQACVISEPISTVMAIAHLAAARGTQSMLRFISSVTSVSTYH